MLLKRLELAGFKSFARKTSFVFDVPVTAVVGPNGSGKSNVAESFRWVLGEQSLTSIRGRRGEDFIFAGSPEASRLNIALVTVVFDNAKRQFPLDYDEVAITREVHRDGENVYRINGTRVRLRDVVELLSAVSLGASQHHVVSQGEADRLLSADFFERREMVEDALGIKIYEYKHNEAKKKLEATRGHMREVESLRRELAPHLKFLEKQVEQIKRADVLRAELCSLARIYLVTEGRYVNEEKEKIREKEARQRDEHRALEIKITELGKFREDENQRLLRDEIGKYEAEVHAIRGKEAEEGRTLGKLEGALEGKREEEARLERSGPQARADAHVPVSAVAAFVGEIEDEVKTALAGTGTDAASLRRVLERVRAVMQTFLERCRGVRREISPERGTVLRHEIEELECKIAAQRTALVSCASEKDAREMTLIRLRDELDAHLAQSRDAERVNYEVLAKKSMLENEERVLSLERDRVLAVEADLKREQGELAIMVGREALILDIGGLTSDKSEVKPPISREEQETRRRKIERLKIRLEETGAGGEDILHEFEETKERDSFLARELLDLDATGEKLEAIMEELERQIDSEFREGVEKINISFNAYFAMLFGGGTANLSVVRPPRRRVTAVDGLGETIAEQETEMREGLDINVVVPRKKVKSLEALSGGERTLVSIALLFAITAVKPPPFLVLDETDAALDEVNSRRYGEMIRELAGRTQLVLITHNRETMSHAGALYGVTLGFDGISRVLSVKFEEAEQMAAR